jgi:DNA-binding MarR family transcriptional regulator
MNKKTQSSLAGQLILQEHIKTLRARSERILIRLVTAIARSCIMHGTRTTSSVGLSVSQTIVLGELFSHNGCRQEDLRVFVALDKGNVTRALQRLEEFGLVLRKQDPVDRRVVRVFVTKKALAIAKKMYALAALWDTRLTVGFSSRERETLVDLLLRMETNARAMARSGETDTLES